MIFLYLCLSMFSIFSPTLCAHKQYNEHKELSTDRVFYRFYLLNRLKPSIDLFIDLIEKETTHPTGLLELMCTLDGTATQQFSHPIVKNEVKHMCMNHDSQTLIRLIKTLKQYRYIHDDVYVKEVVMLLLVIYKNVIANITSKGYSTEGSDYSHMQDMSLEELLETLDTASDSLEQTYENSSLSSFPKPSYYIGLGLIAGVALWLTYK